MKEFSLAEENLTTEFFVFLFFPYFPLFPLDGAIPVNLVTCSTAQHFMVLTPNKNLLLSLEAVCGYPILK